MISVNQPYYPWPDGKGGIVMEPGAPAGGRMTLSEQIEAVLTAFPFGRPSAAKRGRNAKWPWVPVIDYGEQAQGVHRTRTHQVRARAFATREEAVAEAQQCITRAITRMRSQLLNPRYRALREQYGLPREIG